MELVLASRYYPICRKKSFVCSRGGFATALNAPKDVWSFRAEPAEQPDHALALTTRAVADNSSSFSHKSSAAYFCPTKAHATRILKDNPGPERVRVGLSALRGDPEGLLYCLHTLLGTENVFIDPT
ncbi:hypothetical protein F1559_005140 [Cyanidiococcus yangmingshanensis]|uniref:Uncharacterized protein n=1 Tax=Cyanidiococcus yangmingshanensis TaxID=2690220 RepID=A0A7J7IQZ6_9RHOD|nr:hypothetical protein F1559_005140 [Cyanidiococcus yangmingshanensis]